jgi:predicted Zn-ribbon and HTH transcriptional regulator
MRQYPIISTDFFEVKYKLSKKENIKPIAPPCKKTIYDSMADALEAIKHAEEVRRVELKPYQCTICGFWHLTSVKKD